MPSIDVVQAICAFQYSDDAWHKNTGLVQHMHEVILSHLFDKGYCHISIWPLGITNPLMKASL